MLKMLLNFLHLIDADRRRRDREIAKQAEDSIREVRRAFDQYAYENKQVIARLEGEVARLRRELDGIETRILVIARGSDPLHIARKS